MASEFVGFRANRKKDQDIIQALENAKDRTKEIKRLLRLGIAVSNGEIKAPQHQEKPIGEQGPIYWGEVFKEQQPIKAKPTSQPKDAVVANILGGFD